MNDSNRIDRLNAVIADMTEDEQNALLEELLERQSQKKRKHPRTECLLMVNYSNRGRAFQNFIQDISLEGLFIETREKFSVGDGLALTITYTNEQRPFKISGEVTRVVPGGIGIKFIKVSQVQEEIIKAIIKKQEEHQ